MQARVLQQGRLEFSILILKQQEETVIHWPGLSICDLTTHPQVTHFLQQGHTVSNKITPHSVIHYEPMETIEFPTGIARLK